MCHFHDAMARATPYGENNITQPGHTHNHVCNFLKKKGGTINSTNHLSLPVTVFNCSESRDNQKAGNEGHVLCSDRVSLCVFTELCVEHSNEGDTKNGRTSLNVEDV